MQNGNNASPFQKELKSLRVMHLGLMAGLVIVVLNMLFMNNFQVKPALDILVWVALFIAVAAPLAVQPCCFSYCWYASRRTGKK